ncbi:hypothetical protein Vspart_03924 [Vibrio spartinae]|uniref:Uncharacterized protein n=1 Tax=Vibrio spartinae TaxID=1918945 RepID=A0A1N6LZ43_9VIBR|nr:hypothetical protein Vspart_03924 [Vibrio spartinae]SIO92396.1 hypothetical protein VSP9026_00005 [Vibrio spartinae]
MNCFLLTLVIAKEYFWCIQIRFLSFQHEFGFLTNTCVIFGETKLTFVVFSHLSVFETVII